jgi:hypothetical protein
MLTETETYTTCEIIIPISGFYIRLDWAGKSRLSALYTGKPRIAKRF